MRRFLSFPNRGPRSRPLFLALGVFDGVHRGHQAVLGAAVDSARRGGGLSAALTFDPAPEAALGLPVPPRLQHPEEQAECMAGLGLDRLYRVPFTAALGRLTPEAFAVRVLAGGMRAAGVAVGSGFRFGAGAAGTVGALRNLGAGLGFGVVEVGHLRVRGGPVSSTRLREAVARGRLAEARELLGRPWLYRGVVVRGRRLGRTLGFPTANLDSPQGVLPPRGVWAGRCRVLAPGGPSRWWPFAGNLGTRPTLAGGGGQGTVELHLLGFRGSLYGRTLEAEFRGRLRPERKFPDLAGLAVQIGRDVRAARQMMGKA